MKNKSKDSKTLINNINGKLNLFKDPGISHEKISKELKSLIKKVSEAKPTDQKVVLKRLIEVEALIKNKNYDKCKAESEELSSMILGIPSDETKSEKTKEGPPKKQLKSEHNNTSNLKKNNQKDESESGNKEKKRGKPPIKGVSSKLEGGKAQSRSQENHSKANTESRTIINKLTVIDDKVKALSEGVQSKIKTLSSLSEDVQSKVKYLTEDVNHKIGQITKDTRAAKETLDQLENLPSSIKSLRKDIENNITSGATKESINNAPKDVQAIEELANLMRDGLGEFENIAKYYVSKNTEFDKTAEQQTNLDSDIKAEKEASFKEGERKSKVAIANKIYRNFPTDFLKIESIFGDVMSEKYEENEEITIDSKNRQKFEVEIEGIQEDSNYKIKTPAKFIDKDVLIKATVEVSK